MNPETMTDAEIVAAIREGKAVLIPKGGNWSVGSFDLDTWEGFEGEQGLMIELTKEQCRVTAGALL